MRLSKFEAARLEGEARALGLSPIPLARSTRASRAVIALHEAAHATVALAQRETIAEVFIGRRRDKDGGWLEGAVTMACGSFSLQAYAETPLKLRAARAYDRRLHKSLVGLLAGPAGEVLRHGRSGGYASDVNEAATLAMRRWTDLGAVNRHLVRARCDAFELLQRHEAAWERITKALHERGHLSPDEAAALFRRRGG